MLCCRIGRGGFCGLWGGEGGLMLGMCYDW